MTDNGVQLESHAKTNSAKTMELSDKSEEIARASNVGKCVAGDAVFSEPVSGRDSLLTGNLTGKICDFPRIARNWGGKPTWLQWLTGDFSKKINREI